MNNLAYKLTYGYKRCKAEINNDEIYDYLKSKYSSSEFRIFIMITNIRGHLLEHLWNM